MVKTRIAVFLFAVVSFTAAAQNLIPNPGFDSLSSCPATSNYSYVWGPDLLHYASPWRRACWSADLLHDCSFNNLAGPQTAHSGQGKAGLTAWNSNFTNFREFAQTELIHPLLSGGIYYFSMYVSLGDSCRYGVGQLSVAFATHRINDTTACNEMQNTLPAIQLQPVNGSMLETNGWVKLEGYYTASGSETQLIIGNFLDDNASSILPTGQGWRNDSYYYIDDADLELVDFNTVPVPNVFTPNGDGINDVLQVPELRKGSSFRFTIYNRWGNALHAQTDLPLQWNGTDDNGNVAPDGTYFYLLQFTRGDGSPFTQRGSFTLLH
jgi:gliding motility-associated-like protein